MLKRAPPLTVTFLTLLLGQFSIGEHRNLWGKISGIYAANLQPLHLLLLISAFLESLFEWAQGLH